MRVNYGRYDVVAFTPGGDPIYRRGGGHAMSFVGCEADGAQRALWTRDPAQDEGDLFGQSPFTNMVFDIDDMVIFVTEQYSGAIVSWQTRTVSALDFTPGDTRLNLLDTVAWILPKAGYSWTSTNLLYVPLGDQGFGVTLPDSISIPVGGGTIVDVVPDTYGLGVMALVLPEVGPTQVKRIGTASGEVTPVLEVDGAVALAAGSQQDLYVLSNESGGVSATRRFVPAPGGDLDDLGEIPIVVTLPFALHGAAYDDEGSRLVMVSSSDWKLVEAPRDLGAAGDPVQIHDIPTTVPLFGRASVAIEPGSDRTWLVTAGSDSAYGLTVNATGAVDVEELAHPAVTDPTGISFGDGGRLYVRTASAIIVLKRGSGGGWDRDLETESRFEDIALGTRFLAQRSRSNFDAELHDHDAWENIDPVDLPDIGVAERDCLGDVDGDAIVNVADLLALLAAWGPAPGHPADFDMDGIVGVADLLVVLAHWGEC